MLFVREYGRPGRPSPVVITLHGKTATAGEMAPVARRLAPTYRVIEPFRRENGGFGQTAERHVEDLHEVVLSRATDAPPALIGVSAGAMLALLYASTHPEWAGPLVLINLDTVDAIDSAPQPGWSTLLLPPEGLPLKSLVRIQGPVLMIHDRCSASTGALIHRRLRQYLPQIEYCELDPGGNHPWNEPCTTEEFFSILSGWLRETLQPQAL